MNSRNRPLLILLLWLLGPAHFLNHYAAEPDIRWRAGGHFIPVESVDFLSDGQNIISATADVDVKLWNVPSRRLIWTSAAGRFGQAGIAVAPDGGFYVASATELDTNLVVQRISGDFSTSHLGSLRMPSSKTAISPSGQRAAAAGFSMTPAYDRDLRVWNVATGTEIAALPASALSEILFFDRIEFLTEDDLILGSFKTLIRWSTDGTVRWSRSDPSGGDLLLRAVSPNRSQILVEENNAVKLLSASTGELVWGLEEDIEGVWRAAFAPDGSRFILGYTRLPPGVGRLEIRSTDDGALIRTLPITFQRPVPTFSPDGAYLACGHTMGIHITALAGEAIWEPLTETWGPPRRIAICSAQNWVAATADSGRVDLRRLDTGTRFRRVETSNFLATLSAAPDGTWLAFTTNETSLVRYRPETDTFDTAPLQTGTLSILAVSADSSRLLAVSLASGAAVIDTSSWLITAQLRAPQGDTAIANVAWSRNASRVTAIYSSGLTLTYAKDNIDAQFTRDWSTDRITLMEFLPDDETILSLHRSGQLRHWRVTDGVILSEISTGVTNPSTATFSPDQRLLLASSIGDHIRIFSTTTGAELDHWTQEAGFQIRDLEISSDGAWLVNMRLDGALIGLRAPFILYNGRATTESVEFSVSGGEGPYQLQRHPNGPGSWLNVGSRITGRTVSLPDDGLWLYRLVDAP